MGSVVKPAGQEEGGTAGSAIGSAGVGKRRSKTETSLWEALTGEKWPAKSLVTQPQAAQRAGTPLLFPTLRGPAETLPVDRTGRAALHILLFFTPVLFFEYELSVSCSIANMRLWFKKTRRLSVN